MVTRCQNRDTCKIKELISGDPASKYYVFFGGGGLEYSTACNVAGA